MSYKTTILTLTTLYFIPTISLATPTTPSHCSTSADHEDFHTVTDNRVTISGINRNLNY